MLKSLNIESALDDIKIYFFSDNSSNTAYKKHIIEKVNYLSPYQYCHFLAWLSQNVEDNILKRNIDVVFDLSHIEKENYTNPHFSVHPLDKPFDNDVLPERCYEDFYSFFRCDNFSSQDFLDKEYYEHGIFNRILTSLRLSSWEFKHPEINFERLSFLMSFEERLYFNIPNLQKNKEKLFYECALDYLSSTVLDFDFRSIDYRINTILCDELNHLKKLYNLTDMANINLDNIPLIIIAPLLMDYTKWKHLTIQLLKKEKQYVNVKKQLIEALKELERISNKTYFYDATFKDLGGGKIIKGKNGNPDRLVGYSPVKTHYSKYIEWLENLKPEDIKKPIKLKKEKPLPEEQMVISKGLSQKKLKKALIELVNYLGVSIDTERERALESFIYRNTAFESIKGKDYRELTVNNYGYKALNFIPTSNTSDFVKFFLYLMDKGYLLNKKTELIKIIVNEAHQKGTKDGFSYSTLIRIKKEDYPNFPDRCKKRI